MGRVYTPADWEAVDPLLGTMPDKDLAELVPMSASVLCVRRHQLGIKAYPRDKIDWSEADRLMGVVTDREIGRRFCVRPSTVTKRRHRLGIPASSGERLSRTEAYCPRGEVNPLAALFAVRRFA